MFQAERATPTEFRDSHGYDLVGACCALETLLPPAVSALKQFPSADIEADLSFDSFSAASLIQGIPKSTQSSFDVYPLESVILQTKTVNIHRT